MIGSLRNLLGRKRDAGALPPPSPERRTYLTGDIHGMHGRLVQLLARIRKDRGQAASDMVFLGDYIDRGPASAQVLETLYSLASDPRENVICLMGNHERMMLDFLDQPARKGALWLINGGQETLASFGITRAARAGVSDPLDSLSQALRAALPAGMEEWLRRLPLWWRSDTLAAVHAAADPRRPIEDQKPETLLWGHPRFPAEPRKDGIWVAHGHRVVERPVAENGHIAVDTGAVRGGPLTAARVDPDGSVDFLQV